MSFPLDSWTLQHELPTVPLQKIFQNRHGSWLLRLTSVNPQFKKLELSAEDTWPLFRRGARGDAPRRCASVWVGLG